MKEVEMENHLQFVQWLIAACIACGAAWGGTKYALSSQNKRIVDLETDIKDIREDMDDLTPQKTTDKIQEEIKGFVAKTECAHMQIGCGQRMHESGVEVSKKLDLIFQMIKELEEKREKGKDERNAAISKLAKQIAILDTTIKERSHSFRKVNGGNRLNAEDNENGGV